MSNAARWVPFLLVVSALVFFTHLYLYRRLVRDTGTDRRWRRFGVSALVVLALCGVLARLLSLVMPVELAHRVGGLGFVWLGLAIYLVLTLALVDGVRALLRVVRARAPEEPTFSPERRVFLARSVGIGAMTVAGGAGSFGVFRAYYPPRLTDLSVKLPRLPRELSGLTLVQLSDVHAGHSVHEAWMGELVERCRVLQPDLFVITGDLVDGSVAQLGPLVGKLSAIQARFGSYFVTGNHDYYAGAREWCQVLPKVGLEVLRNRHVSIGGTGQPSFDLVGVDDWGQKAREDGTGYDLDRAVAGRDLDRAAVLLAHRPNDFDRAAALGMGLQLSGHTHGGQTFPFTTVAQIIWSRCAGLYNVGDASLYVSRGVGFVGPPMRLGSPPEIVRITLLA